jgi:hypothetical protein
LTRSAVAERRKVKELKASASWVTDVKKFRADFDEQDKDWANAKALKKKIEEHVKNNPDTGLTLDLFNEIVTWKLERQEDRTRHTRAEKVTEDFVRLITTCAFALSHSDRKSLVRGRISVLQGIPGVDMGIASAITALRFPDQHGVIDPVLWKVIYGEERSDSRCPNTKNIWRTCCQPQRRSVGPLRKWISSLGRWVWSGRRKSRSDALIVRSVPDGVRSEIEFVVTIGYYFGV